jgi:membrane protein implicated in regulation of membrane protease activity
MLRVSRNSKLEKIANSLPGIVDLTISFNSPGRVKWQGTTWPARFFQANCQETLVPGQRVQIVTMQGLTLYVIPLEVASYGENEPAVDRYEIWN